MNSDLIIDLSTQYSYDWEISKMYSAVGVGFCLFLFGFINSNHIVSYDNISIWDWFTVGAEKSNPVIAFGVSIEIEIKEIATIFT